MPEEVSDCFNKYFADIGAKVANSVENSNCTFAEYLNNSASENTTFSFKSVEPELVYHLLLHD
jgi:N-acetylneuraminic acid mutarotase